MSCFIKKIFEGKADERAHKQFIRFGRGRYAGRAALSLQKGERIKLGGSFELANDFVSIISEFGGGKVSGVVLSKENIAPLMSKNNIKGNSETKGGGLFYQNNIDEQEISSQNLKELSDNSYASLLDVEGNGFSLKTKKKLPKPGKSGDLKIDDKFCIIEADVKYLQRIKEYFMLPDFNKKCKVNHVYIIEDVIIPKDEKDFVKMREMAKKKGKIIRNLEVDGQKSQTERAFEA